MLNSLLGTRTTLPISVRRESDPFFPARLMLDKAVEDFYKTFQLPSVFSQDWEGLSITPAVDIISEEKKVKVIAEVPGMGTEDLKISITDNVLTITGEKTISTEDKNKNYQSREIAYGSCQRTVLLPEGLDTDNAKATFKKGILWVEIPRKTGSTKPSKQIKVEEIKTK